MSIKKKKYIINRIVVVVFVLCNMVLFIFFSSFRIIDFINHVHQ